MSYFGFYKDLLALNIPHSVSYDMYENIMARYYNDTTERDQHDIEIFLKYASILGGQVLELACGSGRVTIPLAEMGFQVTGIDLSSDMLKIMDEKLKKVPNRVQKRIRTHKCDMTNFNLNQTFRLAILPATSLSLLVEDTKIRSLFKCVYAHLEKGGKFIFDYRDPESIVYDAKQYKTHCYTWNHDEHRKEFVIFSEFIDLVKSRFYINFYAESIEGDTTKRFFGSSEKRLIYDDIIDHAILENFILSDTFTQKFSENEKVKYVILEKR